MKTDPSMYLTGPIDVELWDRARWSGTILMGAPGEPPVLGLAFQDESAARQIFEEWRDRYGKQDGFDELRIAIIEGEVDGEPPGYSIHIGTEPEAAVRRFRAAGFEADPTLLGMITRIQRMTPPAGSENLSQFKQRYRESGRYLLAPGVVTRDGRFKSMLDLSIEKRAVHLRNTRDISPDDLDGIVLKTGQSKRRNLWDRRHE